MFHGQSSCSFCFRTSLLEAWMGLRISWSWFMLTMPSAAGIISGYTPCRGAYKPNFIWGVPLGGLNTGGFACWWCLISQCSHAVPILCLVSDESAPGKTLFLSGALQSLGSQSWRSFVFLILVKTVLFSSSRMMTVCAGMCRSFWGTRPLSFTKASMRLGCPDSWQGHHSILFNQFSRLQDMSSLIGRTLPCRMDAFNVDEKLERYLALVTLVRRYGISDHLAALLGPIKGHCQPDLFVSQ